MKTVIIESPYAGDVERNVKYAQRAMFDCLKRGEAPFASHLLYTSVLDDTIPAQREWGINAGLLIGAKLDKTVVYTDYGISSGMHYGIMHAQDCERPIVYRSIGKNR